jgi:hypothetical protein
MTNNTDIGIYYTESSGSAVVKKQPLMPIGSKDLIYDYVPGEWKMSANIPIETEETKGSYTTFKV